MSMQSDTKIITEETIEKGPTTITGGKEEVPTSQTPTPTEGEVNKLPNTEAPPNRGGNLNRGARGGFCSYLVVKEYLFPFRLQIAKFYVYFMSYNI